MQASLTARRFPLALGLAALFCPTLGPRATGAVSMPGPAPQHRGREIDAAVENARCEQCHVAIAEEWRASLHRGSDVDPVYARAFAVEPLPFCQGCHAPEADADAPVPEGKARIGTGCVTCHLTENGVLAAPRSDAPASPHPVIRDARFASAAACASCHEFDFPKSVLRTRPEPMQATVSEHLASPYAALACADCHMRRVDGHRSHAFSASRDVDMLRQASTVSALRISPTAVRVTLAAGEVGHAFPTGDLFRRLTVTASVDGAPSEVRHLMRRFGVHRVGLAADRTQIADDRVASTGATRDVELELGADAEGKAIHVRVDYERVEHPLSRDAEDAVVEGSILLSECWVAPAGVP
jgi:hypothetical protein